MLAFRHEDQRSISRTHRKKSGWHLLFAVLALGRQRETDGPHKTPRKPALVTFGPGRDHVAEKHLRINTKGYLRPVSKVQQWKFWFTLAKIQDNMGKSLSPFCLLSDLSNGSHRTVLSVCLRVLLSDQFTSQASGDS